MPCFVNAKGVLDEIDRNYGGLYTLHSNTKQESQKEMSSLHKSKRPWTSKTSTLTRLHSPGLSLSINNKLI
jgi:hypothetical protein